MARTNPNPTNGTGSTETRTGPSKQNRDAEHAAAKTMAKALVKAERAKADSDKLLDEALHATWQFISLYAGNRGMDITSLHKEALPRLNALGIEYRQPEPATAGT